MVRRNLLAAFILFSGIQGCVGDATVVQDAGGTDGAPSPGARGGPCFANGTCDTGLTCSLVAGAGVCVDDDGGVPDATSDAGSDAGCGDTSSSKTNCGRCGHDCQGGDCIAGLCQPVQLTTAASPFTLAVDTSNVYFATGTSIVKCSIAGCTAPTPLATNQGSGLSGLAIDATNIYWVGNSAAVIRTCPLANCGTPTTLASAQSNPRVVSVSGSSIYWVNGGDETTVAGHLNQCNITTCNNNPTVLASVGDAWGIASDPTSVYWTRTGTAASLSKCAGAGCSSSPSVLASNEHGAFALAIDSASAYWVTATDGQVLKCSLGGCGGNPVVLASSQKPEWGLAVDATSVYWSNYTSTGTIMACAKTGCNGTPTPLATNQNMPAHVVVDANSIYWLTATAVMKVAKP